MTGTDIDLLARQPLQSCGCIQAMHQLPIRTVMSSVLAIHPEKMNLGLIMIAVCYRLSFAASMSCIRIPRKTLLYEQPTRPLFQVTGEVVVSAHRSGRQGVGARERQHEDVKVRYMMTIIAWPSERCWSRQRVYLVRLLIVLVSLVT